MRWRSGHPFIACSTLAVAPIGATLAKLEGRIECRGGIHLEVWELVDFAAKRIRAYSYEVYKGDEKICWYDSWAHPEIPTLATTFPHHKHIQPNLRDNRVPAPGISFESPNLDCRFGGHAPRLGALKQGIPLFIPQS